MDLLFTNFEQKFKDAGRAVFVKRIDFYRDYLSKFDLKSLQTGLLEEIIALKREGRRKQDQIWLDTQLLRFNRSTWTTFLDNQRDKRKTWPSSKTNDGSWGWSQTIQGCWGWGLEETQSDRGWSQKTSSRQGKVAPRGIRQAWQTRKVTART